MQAINDTRAALTSASADRIETLQHLVGGPTYDVGYPTNFELGSWHQVTSMEWEGELRVPRYP